MTRTFIMAPTVSLITSGLKLLSFQGITTRNEDIIVATIEGDLLKVKLDGTCDRWVNVSRFGIPTGMVTLKGAIAVALSAQETGHFLLQVAPNGTASILADLSEQAGEFGAPFAVTAHDRYYSDYWVAISTDVTGTGGMIARVTAAGKVSNLVTLKSSPFGIAATNEGAVVTLEDGRFIEVLASGEVSAIADLIQAGFGMPLSVIGWRNRWLITTNLGVLVQVEPTGEASIWADLREEKFGMPTTIATFQDRAIVATNSGNLLQIQALS